MFKPTYTELRPVVHRNVLILNILDSQVSANSVDPDQTPRVAYKTRFKPRNSVAEGRYKARIHVAVSLRLFILLSWRCCFVLPFHITKPLSGALGGPVQLAFYINL